MGTLTPLRNIHLSGGFFTENLLLKIRDSPDAIPEVAWSTFGSDWRAEKKKFQETWDWAKLTYDQIGKLVPTWSVNDRFQKWIHPLLIRLGHQPEVPISNPSPFQPQELSLKKKSPPSESSKDDESILDKIQPSYQMHDRQDPALHLCAEMNLDEKSTQNYQHKSPHDHFQRFLLLNGKNQWGILTNGKVIRVLGQYSNIYSKGYIEFDLDAILITRDEAEFFVFYVLLHATRFDATFGLDANAWVTDFVTNFDKIKKQDKKNKESYDEEATESRKKFKDADDTNEEFNSDDGESGDESDIDNDQSDFSSGEESGEEDVVDDDISTDESIMDPNLKDPRDPQILAIYKQTLQSFIQKAKQNGVNSVSSIDVESFMKTISDARLSIGTQGRDLFLKHLEGIIIKINENKSIIERLQNKSQTEGIEIGKRLRKNVHDALELMGDGLLQSNRAFAEKVKAGGIDLHDYYQELLRLAYRMIFILYTEARGLLPDVNSFYHTELSLSNLRKIAEKSIRDELNTDYWNRLLLLFYYLDEGEPALGINAFSGLLFSKESIKIILENGLNLTNDILLLVIRQLTILETENGHQRINYAEIGEEEIGGIYEGLLDFQPHYIAKNSPIYHFKLEEIDSERKGTGSYYTPKGLIDILLKTALKPVIEKKLERLKTKEEKLNAILDLKICDPACGGGSFLLGALDYVGKIYAQIDSEQELPDEKSLRNARRLVLQNCIYGVDLNPIALELAKISLWLKAVVKDKPLTFLDNHLKCGDSLIGFGKKQEIPQIPLNAINAVKGNPKTGIQDEDKKKVQISKERLKEFSIIKFKGKSFVQTTLLSQQKEIDISNDFFKLYSMDESNISNLKLKIKNFLQFIGSEEYKKWNLQADLWTSVFFWNFNKDSLIEIPTDDLILKTKSKILIENQTINECVKLREHYHFFNWFIEFPEIYKRKESGFDCILMNPPWEILNLKETEFFQMKSNEIINTQNQSDRQIQIKKLLKTNPNLHKDYETAIISIKKKLNYIKNVKYYAFSNIGTINIFSNFIERAKDLINQSGNIGCIAPSIILVGKNLSGLFNDLVMGNCINYIFDFQNIQKIFQIHSSYQFCLLSISNIQKNEKSILISFNNTNLEITQKLIENYFNSNSLITENDSLLRLNASDFSLFNPNTLTSPIFSNRKDYEIVKKAYNYTGVLILREKNEIIKNSWHLTIKRMFHPSDDSKLFFTKDQLIKNEIYSELDFNYIKTDEKIYIPLYTGSAIWLYDHRYNEIYPKIDKSKKLKSDVKRVILNKKLNPKYSHIPMYWINKEESYKKFPERWNKNWFIAFRKIARSNDKRTFIVSVIPKLPTIDSLQIIYFDEFRKEIICLIANISSIFFDYIVRNKVSGTAVTHHVVEQLPVFPPEYYSDYNINYIKERVLELTFNSWDLFDFARDFDPTILVPYKWDDSRREILIAELDALFAILYGYSRNEIEYILESFKLLRNYELKKWGFYKSRDLILKSYEKLSLNKNITQKYKK